MHSLTADEFNRLCNEVLSALEIREARLLNWGFINGSQELDDLDAQLPEMLKHLAVNTPEVHAIWQRAQADGITAKEILANLLQRKLIFQSGNHFRSRFAETIRSLFLIRQRFSHDDWQTGERLVGDMRILLQRRRYPRRDISPEELFRQLDNQTITSFRRDAITSLLQEANGQTLALARFQAQAIVRILRNHRSSEDSAVVVGAGTGAGKTKAFYIPALALIAESLSAASYVQALALYPRKELLKDQLRETYAEARKVDNLLKQKGKRPITVGAYYGDVPQDANQVIQGRCENWQRTHDRNGWLCPYFICPECGQQTMAWLDQDLKSESSNNRRGIFGQNARLVCQECNTSVGNERLLLTRQQMVQNPPDILFTTTEMLNRRMSDPAEHALFGIGVPHPPRLVLMDEIHLNEGIHGAQIAYLIRRWRHGRGQHSGESLCIVGLSATVTQAETFFARLTGISSDHVMYITPAETDLVKEGLEYNIVLKGDPLSGAALLSTSVRTAMLICRIMDPPEGNVSAGAFGQRVFAFSDKLDVINRWYHIEKESENPVEPYSRFLFVPANDPSARERYAQGQNWWFVSDIHGDPTVLSSGLQIAITSSQYAGVSESANLIIASSTLEVGYNDPTVGAIIQHKTPFSRAAFTQRRGRAGRIRTMRPWMFLITSAYGHDRWAFQHAESLFDPVLPPLDLPLENYYVQKIQATFALMDWLAIELKNAGQVESIWNLLRSIDPGRDYSFNRYRQFVVQKLYQLLNDSQVLDSFKNHLQGALQISSDPTYTINMLLWGEPRSLLLEVVPTLLRQLETEWQTTHLQDDGHWLLQPWTDSISDRPLPDFVPPALFSDLKSPDLVILIPETRIREGEPPEIRATETLSVALALSEFVPGKVNKRFARKEKIRESHWLQLPDSISSNNLAVELDQLRAEYDPLPGSVLADGTNYSVYCPRVITLTVVPINVRPTSNAYFFWDSNFVVRARFSSDLSKEDKRIGIPIQLLQNTPWRQCFTNLTVYSQSNSTWVEVTRFASQVQVSTRYEDGHERREICAFGAQGQPAAIGFTVDVDALRFAYAPLDVNALRQSPHWNSLYQRFGSQFFLFLLQTDKRTIDLKLSHLEIEWLWQIALTLVVVTAIEKQTSLSEAVTIVQRDYVRQARKIMSIIFQNQPLDKKASEPIEDQSIEEHGDNENDESEKTESLNRESDSPEPEDIGYLEAKLLGLVSEPSIQEMLSDHFRVLWEDTHPELETWVQKTYAFSLGSVLYTTLLELKPDIQADDLHMDVANDCIWISETAAGGIGLIAKLADNIAQYPRRFDLKMRQAIKTCPREELAGHLNQIAYLVQNNNLELSDAFANIRAASDLPRIEDTRRALALALDYHNIPATRQLGMAINTKFLRPNSGPDSDALLSALVSFWHAEQQRLGITIDLRIIAAAATEDSKLREQVQQVLNRVNQGAPTNDAHQVYNLLQSLLWLDCRDGCPDCIDHPQRYQAGPKPSRALLQTIIQTEVQVIRFGQPDWLIQVNESLANGFQACLRCADDDLPTCKIDLLSLLSTPIETGYQILFPTIERIERTGHDWDIQIVIPEMIEG